MMLDANEILNLELSCGKWTAEEQREILQNLKFLNDLMAEKFDDESVIE